MSSTRLEHKHLELYVFSAHKINTCEENKVLRFQELFSGTEDSGNTGTQVWQVRLEGQCRAPVEDQDKCTYVEEPSTRFSSNEYGSMPSRLFFCQGAGRSKGKPPE